ncbi:hypothetical protein CHARACLAT_022935 [Characodon lateralis]|uniref:Uncharacterized protein n=1 Tax=Characodon lateralis TaxID=208331 RepID=A0ABU7DMW8_9TELE|nr:hypothetical protein [Characodon lateralis]
MLKFRIYSSNPKLFSSSTDLLTVLQGVSVVFVCFFLQFHPGPFPKEKPKRMNHQRVEGEHYLLQTSVAKNRRELFQLAEVRKHSAAGRRKERPLKDKGGSLCCM